MFALAYRYTHPNIVEMSAIVNKKAPKKKKTSNESAMSCNLKHFIFIRITFNCQSKSRSEKVANKNTRVSLSRVSSIILGKNSINCIQCFCNMCFRHVCVCVFIVVVEQKLDFYHYKKSL